MSAPVKVQPYQSANDCARAIIHEIERELKVNIPLRICINASHAIQVAIEMHGPYPYIRRAQPRRHAGKGKKP